MNGEKSVAGILKALPHLAGMEETRGLLKVALKQWGGPPGALKILGKTLTRGGLLPTLKDLSSLKMNQFTSSLFVSMWETFGDREAIVAEGKRFSYLEMRDRVFSLANALQAMGVKAKDAVAEDLFNCGEWLEAFYACSLIGAPMPFVNYHLRGEELQKTIALRRPKVLIFDSELSEEIVEIKKGLPTVEHYIVVGDEIPEGMLSYEALIEEYPARMPETNFMVALNPYTAGTTGIPKSANYYDGIGYMLSDLSEPPRVSLQEYMDLIVKTFSFFYWYGGAEIQDPIGKNIRCIIPTPLYHAGTIIGWAPCMLFGGTIIPVRKFDAEQFLRLIETERASWTFVAPTILQRVLALPEEVKRNYYLGSMYSIVCAAAPCPPEVKRDINHLFMLQGARRPVFNEYYASAEIGAPITALLPEDYMQDPKRYASVGKPRCGYQRIWIEEEGRWARPGEIGRVLSRTAMTVSLRYPGSEEKLSENTRIIEGVEWFDDGLLGYMENGGYLYLTGRVKEMIICGGVNLYPQEIEEVILRHPAVFDAAVVRLPHPDLGEVPIACVQLRQGATATEEEVLAFCGGQGLFGYKVPARVEFLEEFPRHIDGKVIKRDLEERYWEGVERRG